MQSLESVADKAHDPLLHRTFGGWMTAQAAFKLSPKNDRHEFQSVEATRSNPQPRCVFALRRLPLCPSAETAAAWFEQARARLPPAQPTMPGPSIPARTAAWWRAFWDRSWVIVDGDQAADVPGDEHPLRIGYDSAGGNRFPGQIEHIRVYGKALTGK